MKQGAISEARSKRRLRGGAKLAGSFALALVVQALLLSGTVFVAVYIGADRREPDFAPPRKVHLPQRQVEHERAFAEFNRATPGPSQLEKLTVDDLLPGDLPDLPEIPDWRGRATGEEAPPVDPRLLLDQALWGGGLPDLSQVEPSRASLFGLEDSGARIVILFDDGGSVLNKAEKSGYPIEKIKEEVIRAVDGYNANTLFGLIHFVRQVGTFKDHLVPATLENKQAAREWVDTHFGKLRKSTGLQFEPDGIQGALDVAFQMEPDIVFIISDADFQRNVPGKSGEDVPWEELSETLEALQRDIGGTVRVNFAGFQALEEHRAEAKKLAERWNGKYKDI